MVARSLKVGGGSGGGGRWEEVMVVVDILRAPGMGWAFLWARSCDFF